MQGTAVQFPSQSSSSTSSSSNSLPTTTNNSKESSPKSFNHNFDMLPRRQRSLSKTQLNYNPINSTSISLLNSPPPPRVTNQNPIGSIKRFPQNAAVLKIDKTTAKDDGVGEEKETSPSIASRSPLFPKTSSSSSTDDKQGKQTANLKTYVHVVKLASFEKPEEYLKILAVPESPDSLKIGRQNMPKATNKITDGFFDSRVLSRSHAELFVKENKLYIRDLKSSNGTFINNKKLEPYKDYELKVGDKLDLGTTLESQVAHKKITCVISEFNYVTLLDYRDFVKRVLEKDDLESKRLQLFNSTVDALIFGELVDERQENDSLLALLGESSDNGEDNTENSKNCGENHLTVTTANAVDSDSKMMERGVKESNSDFVSDLNIKPSSSMQDIIRKLAVAVNNEYIQQQRLKQISLFMRNYNLMCSQGMNRFLNKSYNSLKGRNVKRAESAEVQRLRLQIKDLEDDSAWTDHIIEILQEEKTQLERQLEGKTEIEADIEKYKQAESKYKREISDLEESLDIQKKQNVVLKEQEVTLKDQNNHYKTEMKKLNGEIEALKKSLDDTEEKARSFAKKNTDQDKNNSVPNKRASFGKIMFTISLLALVVSVAYMYSKPELHPTHVN